MFDYARVMKVSTLARVFGWNCAYCGRRTTNGAEWREEKATVDHDIPKSRMAHGGNPLHNEVVACYRCNGAKGNMTGNEFRLFIASRKLPPSYIEYLEQILSKKMRLPEPLK